MKNTILRCYALLFISTLSATPCAADTNSDLNAIIKFFQNNDPASAPVSVVNLDLNVPDSPAFSILGLTPDKVTKPTSLRDIATSLLNGTDIRGNLQSGVAIDISPFRLLNAQEIKTINAGNPLHGLTIGDYRRDYGKQLLYRTEFSIATAKGSSSADPSTKIALGVTTTLFNDGDPVLDEALLKSLKFPLTGVPLALPQPPNITPSHILTIEEVQNYAFLIERLAKKSPIPPTTMPTDDPIPPVINANQDQMKQYVTDLESYGEARVKDSDDASDKARMESNTQLALNAFNLAKARNWNATSWTVGYSPSWSSRTGAFDQLSTNTQGIWTSLGVRAGHNGQILLHVHHLSRELVPDTANDGQLVRQNSDMYGGRIRLGTDVFGVALEGARYHDKPEGSVSLWYMQISIGAEAKITKDYWLALSVGGDNKSTHHGSFVMGSVKWGFNTGATSH